VQWHGLAHKVVIPAVFSPMFGFVAAFCILIAIYWLFARATPGHVNRGFRLGQIASGTWVAFVHGANDSQKTMGVISLALYTHGSISHFYVPVWVKVAAGLAIGAGTYAGGWRVMRTLGQRVFKIDPPSGFAAQAAGGTVLYVATRLGYPVSTTHTISGAVMGAGATKRFSAVRWGVAGHILRAWLLTLPATALLAAVVYWPIQGIF
jgi:PiT family inorganic phosphate transporter